MKVEVFKKSPPKALPERVAKLELIPRARGGVVLVDRAAEFAPNVLHIDGEGIIHINRSYNGALPTNSIGQVLVAAFEGSG